MIAERSSNMLRHSMRWEDTRVKLYYIIPKFIDAEKYLFALKEILTTE